MKEGREDRKRKATDRGKFIVAPWKSDNFVSNLNNNHSQRFLAYSKSSKQARTQYFSGYKNKKNIFIPPKVITQGGISMLVNKDIFELIIGQMLLDEDSDGVELYTKRNALEFFAPQDIDAEI